MDPETVLSTIGTIVSVLCGITQTVTIYSNKKAGSAFYLPINFLRVAHVCQIGWLIYGLMIKSASLIVVNLMTTAITFLNLTLYQSITQKVSEILVSYSTMTLAFLLGMSFLRTSENIGFASVVLNVVTFVTTFEAMYLALKNKNREYIEIKITGVCLFSCIIWTLVGVYMGDSKVIFGSGVGVAISSLSILIYTFLSFI